MEQFVVQLAICSSVGGLRWNTISCTPRDTSFVTYHTIIINYVLHTSYIGGLLWNVQFMWISRFMINLYLYYYETNAFLWIEIG